MAMTVVVTRDVEARYRGFLASAMLEIAPGVYVAPTLSKAVRDRIWDVMEKWYTFLGRGSVSMGVARQCDARWTQPAVPGRAAKGDLQTPTAFCW